MDDLQTLLRKREKLLNRRPHLRTLQNELDDMFVGLSSIERLNILFLMMSQNMTTLSSNIHDSDISNNSLNLPDS